MQKKYNFDVYNLNIINFEELFFSKIDIDLVSDLHGFNLLRERIGPDARKFFFHHIVFQICNKLLSEKNKEKNVFFYNNTQINKKYQVLKYFKEEDVIRVINAVIQKVKCLLPVRIYTSQYSYDFFLHLLEKNDGRGIECLNIIRSYVNNVDFQRYTFSKIIAFTHKNNLTFLNKKYFNQLKTKQLLIV